LIGNGRAAPMPLSPHPLPNGKYKVIAVSVVGWKP
jgi:hypothetical protein